MILAFSQVLFGRVRISIDLRIAERPCPSHHLQHVHALSHGVEVASAEHAGKAFAIFQCDGRIVSLLLSQYASGAPLVGPQ